MRTIVPLGLVLALAAPWAAQAQTAPEIAALRQQIDAMRADYESRLKSLEQRLVAAERRQAESAVAPVAAAAVPAPPPSSPPPGAAAAAPAVAAGASAFNPAMSLILSGLYVNRSREPAAPAIAGVLLPPDAEVGPGGRGFSLAETELGFAASIDPYWRGAAHIALHPDDSVSVEEAYVQTTALGNGVSLKAGRFLSGIGYLNSRHAHTWDFVDAPIAYQALLGTQLGDDGLQLSWVAPTDRYIEVGAEVGRGRSFPGGGDGRNGAGLVTLAAHTGGDIGDSHDWRAGVSVLEAKAAAQDLVGTGSSGGLLASRFGGRTRVWIADAVWKWAPGGNATRTSVKLQGEVLRSVRDGSLVVDPGGLDSAGSYRAVTTGWYLQGVWQFMPGWRLGLRTEKLDVGSPDFGSGSGLYALTDRRPRKTSAMLDYNPSEFSRIRLQVADDRSAPGRADRQLLLQYQMSLGAHGAHRY